MPNLEKSLRNIRRSNRENNEDLEWQEFEADTDPRPIVDPKLEWEADQSGVIHVRKHTSETQVLPGYGVTDFGVSAYEPKRNTTANKLMFAAGFAASGLFAWKSRDEINSRLGTLANYVLLLRESMRE